MIDIANNVAKHPLEDVSSRPLCDQYSYMAVTKSTLDRIKRNDCETQNKLNILPIESLLRRNKLRWYGHVKSEDGWGSKRRDLMVHRIRGPGRP